MKLKYFFILIVVSMTCFTVKAAAAFAEQQERLELSIDDVSQLALNNNFDIQVYELDRMISEKELLKAQAVYDTNVDISYKYDEDRLKRSSVLFGERSTAVSQDAGLSKKLPTGTILSLSASHDRAATDSPFNTLNPYHESDMNFSITQPLAKNFLGVIDRNTIKVKKLDIENAAYTSTDKIEKELADTHKAYWNMLLAYKDVSITDEILDSAQELYAAQKKNFQIGLVEPPEFYAVEANLKERQRDSIFAYNKMNKAANLLKLKLNLGRDVIVEPKGVFVLDEIEAAFDDIMIEALKSRRDYKAAKNDIKAMDLVLQMKKNSLWPEIDISGTIKKNGLNTKFSESVNEITKQDYPEYTVGVTFSFPLENSTAKAEYSQKELEKAKALINLKKIECSILVESHDAFFHAKSMYDSLKLLKDAKELQHKKYLGEEDRFKKGRSDTDRLIRYQQDYLRASLMHSQLLYNYQAALIDLNVTMNRFLQRDKS
ncbi:MAG: TolC family protein [Candidatus Omnitrophota bacterium]